MGPQRLYNFWGAPRSMTQVKIPTTLHNPLFIVCKQRMWNDIQFFHHPASLFSYFGFMSSQRRMSSPAGACWTTTYCCATMLLLMKEVMVVKITTVWMFLWDGASWPQSKSVVEVEAKSSERYCSVLVFSLCWLHNKAFKKENPPPKVCVWQTLTSRRNVEIGCKKSAITSFCLQ